MQKIVRKFLKIIFPLVVGTLFALTIVGNVYGQSLKLSFSHINYEQGLSNSSIECILQDSRGFLWFGTTDGLNRYDGKSIRIYRNEPKNAKSLNNNYIRHLFEDKSGNLWIATDNGLNLFNPKSETFTNFRHQSLSSSLKDDRINYIFQENEKTLWLSTSWGALVEFNIRSGTFTDYYYDKTHPKPADNKNIYCVAFKKPGEFWVGTEHGLKVFNYYRKSFTFIDTSFQRKMSYKIRTIAIAPKNILWLGTEENGVFRVDQSGYDIKHFTHKANGPGSLGNDRIISMLIDNRGRVLIGTVNGGLNIFNEKLQTFARYINDPADKESLSQRSVSAIFEDNQHNLWIGTPRGGVNTSSTAREKFELYHSEANGKGLSYNDVKSFCEDLQGNLWIGTDGGGLNYFIKNSKKFEHYRFNIFDKKSIGSDQVLSLCMDHLGRLWVGTFDGGLNLFEPKTQTFKRYLHDPRNPNSIASNLVESIIEDKQHRLWVCTYNGGLNLFNPETGKFKLIGKDGSADSRIHGIKLISVKEDHEGELWIITVDGGLNRFDPKTGRFRYYFQGNNMPDLSVVFIDTKGRVWAGKKGLYLYDTKKDGFYLFDNRKAINTDYIKNIVENRPGEFWISTSNGIIKYDVNSKSFKQYNTHDGLQGPEYESNSGLKSREGKIYFGGTCGFNAFVPDSIISNQFIPPVYLTAFQIFNKNILPGENSVLKQDVSFTKTIALRHLDNSISFDFAALNFVNSDNNSYAYKLENFDQEWNFIGHKQHAAYTNLDPGKYVFKVRAANNDEVWNPKEASINIIIRPPFWKTWWFISLTVIISGVLAFLAFDFKRQTDLKIFMEKQKEEIYNQQLQFFTNISHEFRTPLSLILGPLEALRENSKELKDNRYLKTIEKSAQRLMNLVTELMDFRKLKSSSIKLRIIPHENLKLFEEIAKEFENIADQKKIAFTFNVDKIDKIIWFDEHIVEKIIYNLLNNAFKYTRESGKISFDVYFSENKYQQSFANTFILRSAKRSTSYFFLRVKDTGIGISADSIQHIFERYYRTSAAHLGSGIGLAFVKSLTELHYGDIYVYSEQHVGTEFIIALPYLFESYQKDDILIEEEASRLVYLESKSVEQYQGITDDALPPPPTAQNDHRNCILLVDDNEELRKFLKEVLESNYTIVEAANGQEGLIIAREAYPDMIISDVMMPTMDGNEFCYQIKNDLETSHIPFVMLTAKDATDAKIYGTLSGADQYLTKPLSVALLQATVANIFKQKRIMKQHYQRDYFSDARELANNQLDKDFIEKLQSIIDSQLQNPELDVEYVSREMGMSQSKLYQKVKKVTGQSIIEFIRSYRLKRAAFIMTHENLSINEVIFRIGIQTASYFTKSFKKEFGKTPSQFLNDIK